MQYPILTSWPEIKTSPSVNIWPVGQSVWCLCFEIASVVNTVDECRVEEGQGKVDFYNLHECLIEWPRAFTALGKRPIILHSHPLLYLIPPQASGDGSVTEIQM